MTTMLQRLSRILPLALLSAGCASGPAAPFDQLEGSNVIALRLQNYEPPPPPPGVTPQGGINIPGLPPEITQWAQQALPGLQQLIPPGLLPPGMLGGAPQQPMAAPQPEAPRFPMSQPNFRILAQTPVNDKDVKEELADLFGDEDNFQADHANCLYAEMGISFSRGGPPNDLVISFSCNQVDARGFAWPHPYRGMKPKTVQELSKIVTKVWPQG